MKMLRREVILMWDGCRREEVEVMDFEGCERKLGEVWWVRDDRLMILWGKW